MLSVCCLAGGPPARLAQILSRYREVAGEIVVAVDERVDPATVSPLSDLADVLVRYPFAPPVERPFAWLHSLCSGEWVFRTDDDEAPSAALLELLAAPPASLTHVWVPRRWLWHGGWIDQRPWTPDWQLRLVRPEAARFPGRMHIPIQADGPHAYVDAPLYHLDLLINDRVARAEKAARYDRERSGMRIGGRRFNEAYYLPETRDVRVALLDEELHIDLNAPEVRGETDPLRLATREEIDAQWLERPFDSYQATVEVLRIDPAVAGEVVEVLVSVTNEMGEQLPGGRDVRLSYRGLGEGLRTPLPHDLAPGECALVPVAVAAPDTPGDHSIEVGLVHERHRWFGTVATTLEVRPRQRAVILVGQPPGDEAFDASVDSALAALDSSLEPLLVGPKPDWLRHRFGVEAAERPPARADHVVVLPAGRKRERLRLWFRARTLRRDAER